MENKPKIKFFQNTFGLFIIIMVYLSILIDYKQKGVRSSMDLITAENVYQFRCFIM